jgi:hypothetical protein
MDDFSISLNDIKRDLGKTDSTKKLNDFNFISNDVEDVQNDTKIETPKKPIQNNTNTIDDFDLSLEHAFEQNELLKQNQPPLQEPVNQTDNLNEPKPQEETKAPRKEDIANSDDVNFVHGLYKASNFQIPWKVNALFVFFISLIVLLIMWGNFATVDELTRGEGKVIPSSKIQRVQYLDLFLTIWF